MTLYADTINGVMRHGDDDLVTEIISNEKVFFQSLKDLKDNEYIKCPSVSKKMACTIWDLYGIHP